MTMTMTMATATAMAMTLEFVFFTLFEIYVVRIRSHVFPKLLCSMDLMLLILFFFSILLVPFCECILVVFVALCSIIGNFCFRHHQHQHTTANNVLNMYVVRFDGLSILHSFGANSFFSVFFSFLYS